jgi:hypothetical protein
VRDERWLPLCWLSKLKHEHPEVGSYRPDLQVKAMAAACGARAIVHYCEAAKL